MRANCFWWYLSLRCLLCFVVVLQGYAPQANAAQYPTPAATASTGLYGQTNQQQQQQQRSYGATSQLPSTGYGAGANSYGLTGE